MSAGLRRVAARITTLFELARHFATPSRFLLVPLLGVLLLGGVLLWLTGGLSYVAPFVYALF